MSNEPATDSSRPKVPAFLAVSLDGFIATPDGGVEWLDPFGGEDDDGGYMDFFETVDCMLIGRNTWEVVEKLGGWLHAPKPLFVRTHRPLQDKHNETIVQGPILKILADLKIRGFKHVYIDGGVTIRDALKARALDQMVLTRVPHVLGDGIPFFDASLHPGRWTLLGTRNCKNGALQATYQPWFETASTEPTA